MAAPKSALLNEELHMQAENKVEIPANAGLSLVESQADRVDPIAMAMDQALGLEGTRPFTTLSRWNTHAVDFAWSLAPVVCDLFSLAVKACVELQLSWLSWIPGWDLGVGGNAALEDDEHRRMTLAESMDIAIGAEPAQPAPVTAAYAAVVGRSRAAAAAGSGRQTVVQESGSNTKGATAAAAGMR